MSANMINVLVVEDSLVVREFLVHVLGSDPQIRVIGTAANGEEALEATRIRKPDVITMDIHMPKMDGFEATRRIMETQPVPIIIVSGSSTIDEVATTFRALEMGALTVIPRPDGIGNEGYEASAEELIQTVKLMSEVKVVKRWSRARAAAAPRLSAAKETGTSRAPARIDLVAIGASTGGPMALKAVLSGLPGDFPVPVVIVQHIATGFLQGLVDWLAGSCALSVQIARHGDLLRPGQIYVAPDGLQLVVRRGGVIALIRDETGGSHCPSVSSLFLSVAEVYGRNAAGVLLTGMGRDGADELKLLKDRGAITFAQDKDSSIVHGMPGEAIRLDAATLILPPEKIAAVLTNYTNNCR